VPGNAAQQLFHSLCEKGFVPVPGEPTEQHLAGLRSPRGGLLEIHFALRGLRDEADRTAELETLARWESLERLDGYDGESFRPTPDLLAAHLLVHGVQQHFLRPQTYALFRMIADLSDLLPNRDDWESLQRRWGNRFGEVAPAAEVETIKRLCQQLRAGQLPAGDGRHGIERLFGHLLAGSMDRDYAESLAARYLQARLKEAKARGELGEYLLRKLRTARASLTEARGPGEDALPRRISRALARQVHDLMNRMRLR